MQGGGGGLAEIQQELQAVKQALRKGAVHLGLQGEHLQRYLLQLNEKENLLLSRQLRHMDADSYEPLAPLPPPAAAGAAAAARGPAAGGVAAAPNGTSVGKVSDVAKPSVEPAQPPPGPVAAFDRENLNSVLSHLQTYEGVSVECARALRALSSLAYADAQAVGDDSSVLPQVMRVLAIHPGDDAVCMAAIRSLCNMAYNQSVATNRLTESSVMATFLDGMVSKNSDLRIKSSEAIARIVAASQVGLEGGELAASVAAKDAAVTANGASGELGGLCALFLAASAGKYGWQEVVPRLVTQLVENEVVEVVPVAKAFTDAGRQCAPAAAKGWLALAKLLSLPDCPCPELPQPLVDAGTIGAAAALMERCEEDGVAQLAGIEALSSLVGSRWAGLQAFAEVGGMLRIEAAMRAHGEHVVLQTKGIRALASGVQWPQDIQSKAQYSHVRAIELTKAAMAQHGGNAELQIAALEGLNKYLEKTRCIEEVGTDGLGGLVKAMMARHAEESKVQMWGRNVLGAIGEDRNWAPRGAQP